MISINTETELELSSPVVIDQRKIFVVSQKLSLTSRGAGRALASLVTPIYIIVQERRLRYAFSLPKGERVDLHEVLSNKPTLEREFSKATSSERDLEEIIKNENRVTDLYPSQSLNQIYGEETMTSMSSEKESGEHERRMEMEEVRKHIMSFGSQLHEYLDTIQAEVENYKFTVEKHGEGVEVEVQFKAYVHPKTSDVSKIIPK